jgi:hypothetical protein
LKAALGMASQSSLRMRRASARAFSPAAVIVKSRLRRPAPFGRGFPEPRTDEALFLHPPQRPVHGAQAHGPLQPPLDFFEHRHAVGLVVQEGHL